MSIQQDFEKLVRTMDVPESRKQGTIENALWYLRNGGICNLSHQNFEQVTQLAIKIANS